MQRAVLTSAPASSPLRGGGHTIACPLSQRLKQDQIAEGHSEAAGSKSVAELALL